MSEALSGVDLSGFEPTQDTTITEPSPFSATAPSGQGAQARQDWQIKQDASGSAGPGNGRAAQGKDSETRKAEAREYHARLAQYILNNLPQGDTGNLPHHDDEVTVTVGDKQITMTQGQLFQLARRNASSTGISPEQQLVWARIAQTVDPRLEADTEKANEIIKNNPAVHEPIETESGWGASPRADDEVKASATEAQSLDIPAITDKAVDDDLSEQIIESAVTGSRPPPVYELVDGPQSAAGDERTLPSLGDAFAGASLLPEAGADGSGLLPDTGLDLTSGPKGAETDTSSDLPAEDKTAGLASGSGLKLG